MSRSARTPTLLHVGVAAAALLVAGCGDDAGTGVGADVPTSDAIELIGTEMAYDPDVIAVEEGTIDVVLHNEGVVVHDIRIEDRWDFIVEAKPGETASGQVALEAGGYTIFCSIPGHRAAGMEAVLEVRPSS